jgi:hypothetical protein
VLFRELGRAEKPVFLFKIRGQEGNPFLRRNALPYGIQSGGAFHRGNGETGRKIVKTARLGCLCALAEAEFKANTAALAALGVRFVTSHRFVKALRIVLPLQKAHRPRQIHFPE